MSLITHCPACGTTFKVVRDQLKISEGWVRCGHCTEVFDSTPNLREIDLGAVASSESVWQDPSHTFDEPHAQLPAELDICLDELELLDDNLLELEDEYAAEAALPPPIVASFAEGAIAPRGSDFTELAPEVAQAQDFSFIVKVPAHSHWHKPLVRVGLGVSVVLLLFCGALQIIVHVRDRIAAVEPRARHALQEICGLLHCQVRPLRRIEAIAVDSSSFSKQHGGTYLLSFVVKNTGDVELEMPTIELTLTDSQDAPLVRRVLLPAELMANKSSVLAAGAEWPGAYVMAVTGPALGAADIAKSVAGYRVLAFYP